LRGIQSIYSDEKYNKWNYDNDVTNFRSFNILSGTTELISHLKQTYSGVTIKNNLELSIVNGGNIQFKDPWLIDYPDPLYGYNLRNRGMDDAGPDKLEFKSRPSPFYPDYSTSYSGDVYQGVFLGQMPDPSDPNKPYYSVKAESPQTININGRDHTFYFQNWEASPSNGVTFQNASSLETAVVFNSSGTTVKAVMKGTELSNSTVAFNRNSQRKVVRTDNGTTQWLNRVYESMGYVWYERSTDNGSTWEIMNSGQPLSTSESRSPAIDINGVNLQHRVMIVYTQKNGDYYKIILKFFENGTCYDTEELYNEPYASYSTNTYPALSWSYNGYIVVVWKRHVTSPYLGDCELMYWCGRANSYGVSESYETGDIDGSTDNSEYPTLAATKSSSGNSTEHHLAWQEGWNYIKYKKLTVLDQEEMLWEGTTETPSSGCSYPTNYYPSININSGGTVGLVWVGSPYYGSTSTKVIYRSKGSSWSSTFGQYGNSVHSPTLGYYSSSSHIIGWGEGTTSFTNKVLRWGSVKTLSTTGKDIQMYNTNSLSNMKAISFQSVSSPYSFASSETIYSLSKGSDMSNGKQCVLFTDAGEFFLRVGDINLDDENICFEKSEEDILLTKLTDLNSNLVTEAFNITDNSKFEFSVEYGFINAENCKKLLGSNNSVTFKIGIIDANSDEVIGCFDKFIFSSKNELPTGSKKYSLNTKGIEASEIYMRINVESEIESKYSIAEIISDSKVFALDKENVQDVTFSELLVIQDYSLLQNYPNPRLRYS